MRVVQAVARNIFFADTISRKELLMEWDQIEDKWTAMTRRIRADWKTPPQSLTATNGARSAVPPAFGAPSDKSPADAGAGDTTMPTHS